MAKKKLSALELIQHVSGNVKNDMIHVGKNKEELTPDYWISFGSVLVNCLVSGDPYKGMPGNVAINLTGDFSTGKTLIAELLAKNFYEMFSDEAVIDVYETEGAIDANQWSTFVNLNNMVFTRVNHIIHLKRAMVEKLKVIKRDHKWMFITDSLGALPDSETYTKTQKDDDTKVMGKKSQEINNLFGGILDPGHKLHVPMVFINRKYQNFDVNKYTKREDKESHSGGKGTTFSPSISLDFRKNIVRDQIEYYNDAGEKKKKSTPIRVEIEVYSDKNRYGREHMGVPLAIDLKGTKGLMPYFGLVDYAIRSGLLEKTTVKGHGNSKFWKFTFNDELFKNSDEITDSIWEEALENGLADFLRKEFTRPELFNNVKIKKGFKNDEIK